MTNMRPVFLVPNERAYVITTYLLDGGTIDDVTMRSGPTGLVITTQYGADYLSLMRSLNTTLRLLTELLGSAYGPPTRVNDAVTQATELLTMVLTVERTELLANAIGAAGLKAINATLAMFYERLSVIRQSSLEEDAAMFCPAFFAFYERVRGNDVTTEGTNKA